MGKPDLLRLGAVVSKAEEPPLVVADTRRLTNETDCCPHITLEAGLAQTINWWARQRTSCRFDGDSSGPAIETSCIV